MRDRIRSLVYGLAIGDALGVPYEFMPRGTFECEDMSGHGTHDQPAGTWSDDTSMTLATIDSLATKRGFDARDMRARFEQWLFGGLYTCDGYVFDCGSTTSEALRTGSGMGGERDNGNGSLMRILPLALMPGVLGGDVREASAITHAHDTSKRACMELVMTARQVMDGERPVSIFTSRDQVPSGGYVLDTLSASRWCVATSESYEEAVLKAVNLGGDTDTTAAVTGGLAGLLWGHEAIPERWVAGVRGRWLLEKAIAEWPDDWE